MGTTRAEHGPRLASGSLTRRRHSPRHVAASSAIGIALVGLVATLAITTPAHALECGERLVEIGDPAAYVRSVCGEPRSITPRTESRTQWVTAGTPPRVTRREITITVQLEVWVYDFGPTRFMEELTFENGVVRDDRTLGMGTGGGDRSSERGDEVHHHRDAAGHRDAERHGRSDDRSDDE